jgi:capsule biosynthesis phosphatase
VNIVILAAGEGKRFIEEGYTEPKPMIKVLAKPIISWLLDSLILNNTDNIILVLNKNHSSYRIKDFIQKNYSNYKLHFHEVDYTTRGAAETLYSSIYLIENNDPIIVLDSDTFYTEDILSKCRSLKENFIFYFDSQTIDPIYSYISIKNNLITEIKEKNKISNNACSGAYGFKDKNIIKTYCEHILDKKIKSKNEYYVSGLYQEMIKDGHQIFPIEVDSKNIVCLGTPNQIRSFATNKTNQIFGKTFCFDLDNTLVTHPKIQGDYTTVEPIQENIDILNSLKENNKIIIYTARRMKTFNGDIEKVIENISDITKKTLKDFNIKYDELIFGKPYADYYIDDLAINSTNDVRQQLGLFENYIEPRRTNKIIIKQNQIIKETSNLGEIFWYQNIPKSIQKYFPQIYNIENNIITMEKLSGIPLSYVFINGTMTKHTLFSVMDSLEEIHNSVSNYANEDICLNYSLKIKDRFDKYDYSKFKDSQNIYKYLLNFFKSYKGISKVIHGDPVFTNIFIDDSIKFIDMRGSLGNNLSIFGDENYDWGKLYQSIIGYDFILLNKKINYKTIETNKQYFIEWFIKNKKENQLNDIEQITNSLLFSLLPLHDNDKCIMYYNLIRTEI